MSFTTFSSAGYSPKPLPDKLGYKPGMVVAFVALPEELAELAAAADFAKVARRQDWSRPLPAGEYDLVHAFTKSREELSHHLHRLQKAIKRDGAIWVSWPKKASHVPTDVSEDVVRAEALKLDLVDVKVAAVDNMWSGLKLVIRVDRR
ncbi:MAG: DUF3052 domain-containing protein [Rhizobiales bacterium]|nr:DUF3052 domain-containing protein [Hyphomicrobiales bacterium]